MNQSILSLTGDSDWDEWIISVNLEFSITYG